MLFLNLVLVEVDDGRRGSGGNLVKLSCHDSGIDIRDPPPPPVPTTRKTVYSDADILLGDGDFVPPIPVQPLVSTSSAPGTLEDDKKKQGVSFSLEDSDKMKSLEDKFPESKRNKVHIIFILLLFFFFGGVAFL